LLQIRTNSKWTDRLAEFRGTNYRANIWLNGKQIAKSDDVAGAWRTYEFNITDATKPGADTRTMIPLASSTSTKLSSLTNRSPRSPS
jgi:hypothetical protein